MRIVWAGREPLEGAPDDQPTCHHFTRARGHGGARHGTERTHRRVGVDREQELDPHRADRLPARARRGDDPEPPTSESDFRSPKVSAFCGSIGKPWITEEFGFPSSQWTTRRIHPSPTWSRIGAHGSRRYSTSNDSSVRTAPHSGTSGESSVPTVTTSIQTHPPHGQRCSQTPSRHEGDKARITVLGAGRTAEVGPA